jgi:hypothetical protein
MPRRPYWCSSTCGTTREYVAVALLSESGTASLGPFVGGTGPGYTADKIKISTGSGIDKLIWEQESLAKAHWLPLAQDLAGVADNLERALQRRRNAGAIELLDEWMSEDPDYDIATWPAVKAAIESNRLSDRKRFRD